DALQHDALCYRPAHPDGIVVTQAAAPAPAPLAPPAPAAPVEKPNLRKSTYRSSVWTFFEYGFNQAFRFASNLILIHWLAKEAFGLMALVTLFLTGLQMFSDIGIGPNIIQSKRGEDP